MRALLVKGLCMGMWPVLFLISSVMSCAAHTDFVYGKTVHKKELLAAAVYKNAVESLPICCIDVFVYNPKQKTYLLVLRNTEPAKGAWWYPGGRLYKGETFFACAQRKCSEELGLTVVPCAVIGVYATHFDTSAWDCPTHTVNIAVLAELTDSSKNPAVNEYHTECAHVALDTIPDDSYLKKVYYDTRAILSNALSA